MLFRMSKMSLFKFAIFNLLRREMRRPFLEGGDDYFENSSSALGMKNHERNEEFEDR